MNVEEFLQNEINRRQFLGKSAQNAAGVAVGMVGLSAGIANAAPSETVRVGVIGVRGQGTRLAMGLAKLPAVHVATICDVDQNVFAKASQSIESLQGTAPKCVNDFRHVLDDPAINAVVIAAPDHWHAIMTIMACQAEKDVYVEKPVSHCLHEGTRMVEATRKYNRIVQSGLQQRSGSHFQSAVELVRSGRLGRVKLAKAWTAHRRKSIGYRKDGSVPTGVDYDMWLGPARERRFNANRFHHNWHWFWEYGTGELGNWGVHMLDIARWGLGVELPHSIAAAGGKYHFRDAQETPDTLNVQFRFRNKSIMWEHRQWSNHGIEGRSAATAFYGEKGTLVVDRGGWKVYDCSESLTADSSELLQSHLANFVECIKTRQRPTADIEIGHVSSAMCHLGNISYRLGREVQFDVRKNDFGADADANELLTRAYREPWELPDVTTTA